MSALNRAVFCLECGTLIAEADIPAHLLAPFTDHALVRLHYSEVAGPGVPVGTFVTNSTIMIRDNGNPHLVTTGFAGQHYHDQITGVTYICTQDGNLNWDVT